MKDLADAIKTATFFAAVAYTLPRVYKIWHEAQIMKRALIVADPLNVEIPKVDFESNGHGGSYI